MRLPIASALVLALSACNGGSSAPATSDLAARVPSEEAVGRTVAKVNGLPVGVKEYDLMAARNMGRDGRVSDEARADVVDRLVDEKLLYQEALRQGIDLDPKIQKMMVNTLLKDRVYTEVRNSEIDEAELRAYFAEHSDEFVVPEKVQIKRILVKPDDGEDGAAVKARAEAVRAEVVANASDFKSLAAKYSRGPYARRGGDLGYVTSDGKPGVDPLVVSQGFALAKGGVSEAFEASGGWNIVYVPNRRERVERTYEQMRPSVLRKVKAAKYKGVYDAYVDTLRKNAEIWVDEPYLAGHEIQAVRPLSVDAAGKREPVVPPTTDPAAPE